MQDGKEGGFINGEVTRKGYDKGKAVRRVCDYLHIPVAVHGVRAMIMGALYTLTVVCGIYHMYNVIEAGMLSAVEKVITIENN